jgi:protein TonB
MDRSLPSALGSDVPRVQRGVSLALAVALHALLLFLLLRLAPLPPPPELRPVPTTVELIPAEKEEPAQARKSTERRRRQARSPARPRLSEPQPRPDEDMSDFWSKVIPMTRDQMAAVDHAIRASPPADQDRPDSGEPAQLAELGRGDPGLGSGPNGEPLYNAQWYRKPTHAELSTYMPAGAASREGWGMIACRTIADYRVDDCLEIAQSPAGSGLAGAVRKAAWQFRVIPPRIGGKHMVGAWVRIRIEYTMNEVH